MNDKAAHRSSKAVPQWRRQFAAVGVLLALVAGVALGEWFGWPFLAEPLQRLLSDTLDRRVRFSADADPNASDPNASHANAFRVRFVGGLRLLTPQLEIAAPAWSSAPHLLLARDVALDLRYADLWRAYQGQPLRIQRLQAALLDACLERLVDGRASWQFGQKPESMALPSFGSLQVTSGTLHYRDMPLAADVEARFSVVDGALQAVAHQVTTGSKAVALDQSASVMQPASVLQMNASGYYRKLPLKMELVSSGRLTSSDNTAPVAVTLNATLGRATLAFKGSATSALYPSGFSGRFSLKGPSFGAVGELIGVTLPTTAEFQTDGVIDKQGSTSRVRINDATVGSSRLNGAFIYEKNRSVPLLSGQLGGARLLLADLGPALGTMPAGASTLDKSKIKGKVLPDRQYDLPALRAMDADVLIDISHVDLNTSFLEPLHPLHGHLQLKAGVLTLQDIDARTAQGQLKGDLRLDGRGSKALWNTNLRWDGVRLERWIHQARAEGLPPFVSGRMSGRATLQGQGRSTAEILADLKGNIRTELHDGVISHLAVEVAGLNLGESLGILIKGDDVLPVQCAVADLVAEGGVLRPRVMVLDTKDSTIWVVGSLSLATEKLDLRAVVSPKSFSPLTLRAPLRVRGSFASPQVSLDKRPMGLKLATSFLLALVNPLAALIPLVDSGDAGEAKRTAALCQGVMQRGRAKPAATAR